MNAPTLRFMNEHGKDFPSWESDFIENLFTIKAGGDISPENVSEVQNEVFKYPIYANSDKKLGLYGFSDICKIKEKSITVTGRGHLGVAVARNEPYYPIVRLLTLIPKCSLDIYFFAAAINRINFHRESTGVPQLTAPQLSGYKISFPVFEEQTKIANFLTALDEKITQLTQKYEFLDKYKKGIIQQILSQELRFKNDDGQDFPEWEEKTIDEVCVCLDNKRKPLNDAERQTMQGEIPYWGANNIMDYVNDYIFDETIILLAEDGGNFNEYKTRPIANISHGKCWVNNHTHVLKGKNGFSNEFLFYSLVHKNITGYVSGGTRAKLTKGEMLKILIDMPTSFEERIKIANFLINIDKKISANQLQLKLIKQYKQGLLQQMFV
jgi:type I restriction enzyme S subunit